MSFTVNNNSSFRPSGPSPRKPITIEGERAPSATQKPTNEAQSSNKNSAQPYSRVLEAKPVKDDTQLLGSEHIYTPRSPLAAFASIAQSNPHSHNALGSSIDTYA